MVRLVVRIVGRQAGVGLHFRFLLSAAGEGLGGFELKRGMGVMPVRAQMELWAAGLISALVGGLAGLVAVLVSLISQYFPEMPTPHQPSSLLVM